MNALILLFSHHHYPSSKLFSSCKMNFVDPLINYCPLSPFPSPWASLVAQLVENPPAMWETWVQSLGWAWASLAQRFPASSVLAREGAPQLLAFSPGKEQAAGVWETCLAPGWPQLRSGLPFGREPSIPPSVGTFSELPNLAVAERRRRCCRFFICTEFKYRIQI